MTTESKRNVKYLMLEKDGFLILESRVFKKRNVKITGGAASVDQEEADRVPGCREDSHWRKRISA